MRVGVRDWVATCRLLLRKLSPQRHLVRVRDRVRVRGRGRVKVRGRGRGRVRVRVSVSASCISRPKRSLRINQM